MNDKEMERLAKSSRRTAVISMFGVIVVLLSLAYSSFKIASTERMVQEKQQELGGLDLELRTQAATIDALNRDVESLRNTQYGLLDFLSKVTDDSQVSILDRDVDWGLVKSAIDGLPNGARKRTVLTAILLAWKEIPFAMGKQSMTKGFDSPRFIEYVLSKNGIKVTQEPNERMSAALMRSFEKVTKPRPGDLVFYRGQVGSFGFIYVSDGKPSSAGIGIGTLQQAAPLQVISLDNVNTPYFPLIGYFRVRYPDEISEAQPIIPSNLSRQAAPSR